MNKKSERGGIVHGVLKVGTTEKGRHWARLGMALLVFPALILLLSLLAPAALSPALIALQLKVFFSAAAIAAICIAFPRVRNALQILGDKLRTIDLSLDTSQRLYRSVLILSLGILLLAWLDAGPLIPSLVWLLVAFCVFVALFDALRWYRSFSEHALGKALIGIGFASASTLAYAIARQEIAATIHVTPTNFTHTTLLMAIMTIPALVVLAGGLVYVACTVASFIVVPFLVLARDAPLGVKAWLFAGVIKDNPIKYPLATKVFQFLFYGTLGLVTLRQGGVFMVRYESELQKRLPAAIYHLDMYQGRECKLQQGEKLSPLGDSKFLVGKQAADGRIEFLSPVKCDELPAR